MASLDKWIKVAGLIGAVIAAAVGAKTLFSSSPAPNPAAAGSSAAAAAAPRNTPALPASSPSTAGDNSPVVIQSGAGNSSTIQLSPTPKK